MAKIKELVLLKIADKIEEVNLEKDDGLDLDCPPENAYFLQFLSMKMTNYNPFIFYGIQNITPSDDAVQPKEDLEIFLLVCFADSGLADEKEILRLYRYTRVLKEIIYENFNFIPGFTVLNVADDLPASFRLEGDGALFHSSGVLITASIGH